MPFGGSHGGQLLWSPSAPAFYYLSVTGLCLPSQAALARPALSASGSGPFASSYNSPLSTVCFVDQLAATAAFASAGRHPAQLAGGEYNPPYPQAVPLTVVVAPAAPVSVRDAGGHVAPPGTAQHTALSINGMSPAGYVDSTSWSARVFVHVSLEASPCVVCVACGPGVKRLG